MYCSDSVASKLRDTLSSPLDLTLWRTPDGAAVAHAALNKSGKMASLSKLNDAMGGKQWLDSNQKQLARLIVYLGEVDDLGKDAVSERIRAEWHTRVDSFLRRIGSGGDLANESTWTPERLGWQHWLNYFATVFVHSPDLSPGGKWSASTSNKARNALRGNAGVAMRPFEGVDVLPTITVPPVTLNGDGKEPRQVFDGFDVEPLAEAALLFLTSFKVGRTAAEATATEDRLWLHAPWTAVDDVDISVRLLTPSDVRRALETLPKLTPTSTLRDVMCDNGLLPSPAALAAMLGADIKLHASQLGIVLAAARVTVFSLGLPLKTRPGTNPTWSSGDLSTPILKPVDEDVAPINLHAMLRFLAYFLPFPAVIVAPLMPEVVDEQKELLQDSFSNDTVLGDLEPLVETAKDSSRPFSAGRSHGALLHGPPGTGKSEVLSAYNPSSRAFESVSHRLASFSPFARCRVPQQHRVPGPGGPCPHCQPRPHPRRRDFQEQVRR